MRTSSQQAEFVDQRYDFATGQAEHAVSIWAGETTASVDVLTFCSKKQPTIVLQEVAVEVDHDAELTLRAIVDISQVLGRVGRRRSGLRDDTPKRRWVARVAIGWRAGPVWGCLCDRVPRRSGSIATDARLGTRERARHRGQTKGSGRPLVHASPDRQPGSQRLHEDPDRQATRLVCRAAADGFEALREENRIEWRELWKARVLIDADDERWQTLADAAFFYLKSSVHPSAPSSTSIFGLAQWNDYHYYYGHVMWDVDLFRPPVAVRPT